MEVVFFCGIFMMLLAIFVLLTERQEQQVENDDELVTLRHENATLRAHIQAIEFEKKRSDFHYSAIQQELMHMIALLNMYQSEWENINSQILQLRGDYTKILVARREDLLLHDADHFTLESLRHNLQFEKQRVLELQTRVRALQARRNR